MKEKQKAVAERERANLGEINCKLQYTHKLREIQLKIQCITNIKTVKRPVNHRAQRQMKKNSHINIMHFCLVGVNLWDPPF